MGAVDSRTLHLYRTYARDLLHNATAIHKLVTMLLITTFELDVNLSQHLSHRGERRRNLWQPGELATKRWCPRTSGKEG